MKEFRAAKKEAKKEERLVAGVARIDRNLSYEYKESSRFDAYAGDQRKTTTLESKPLERVGEAQDETPLDGDDPGRVAIEAKRGHGFGALGGSGSFTGGTAQDLVAPKVETPLGTTVHCVDTDRVDESNKSEKVETESNREQLVLQAIDPELWDKAPEPRFRAVMRMVVQAGEASTIAHLVPRYWASRGEVLGALGFDSSGAWREVIIDATAVDWLTRGLAATAAIAQALSALSKLRHVQGKAQIDLVKVSKGFPAMTGVRIDPAAAPRDPRAVLELLLGGAEATDTILTAFGLDARTMLDTLAKTANPEKWFLRQAQKSGLLESDPDVLEGFLGTGTEGGKGRKKGKGGQGTGDADKEALLEAERSKNALVVGNDQVDGELRLAVPMLAIAAIARRSGTTLVKSSTSFVSGVEIVIKRRTAFDRDRLVTLRLGEIALHGLMIVSPESMASLDRLGLKNVQLQLASPETRPATWLEKVTQIAQHIGTEIAMSVGSFYAGQAATRPAIGPVLGAAGAGLGSFVGGLGAGLGPTVIQLVQGLMNDASSASFEWGGFEMEGFAESGGGSLDELSVGGTRLSIEDQRGLGFHRGTLFSKKEARLEKLERREEKVEGRKEALESKLATVRDMQQGDGEPGAQDKAERRLQGRIAAQDEKLESLKAKQRANLEDLRSDTPEGRGGDGEDVSEEERQKERERDLVPKSLLKERAQVERQLEAAQKKVEIAQKTDPDGKRARSLADKCEQLERVKARVALTIADEMSMSEVRLELKLVDDELAKLEARSVKAPSEDERQQLEAEQARLAERRSELKRREQALQIKNLEVDGKIGAIEMKGLALGGMEAGRVSTAETTITTTSGSKDPSAEKGPSSTRGIAIKNQSIVIEDLKLVDGRRRDVLLTEETNALQDRLAELLRTGSYDPKAKESLEGSIAARRQELRRLEPVVAEYDILLGRVRELDENERARLLELKQQLEVPPNLVVKRTELTDVVIGAEATLSGDGKVALERAEGSIDLGGFAVSGIEKRDLAPDRMGGDLTVASVLGKNASIAAMTELLNDPTAANRGGTGSIEALEVKQVVFEGSRTEARRRTEELGNRLSAVEAQLEALGDKQPRTEADRQRQAALEAQRANLRLELADLERDHLAHKPLLEGFLRQVGPLMAQLVDRRGIDQSRACTVASLRNARGRLESDLHATRTARTEELGKKPQYDKGIAALQGELAELRATHKLYKTGTQDPRTVSYLTTLESAITERMTILERARAARSRIDQTVAELDKKAAELGLDLKDNARLDKVMQEVIAAARAAGLTGSMEANALKYDTTTAYQLGKLAESGRLEGEDLKIGSITATGFSVGGQGSETQGGSGRVNGSITIEDVSKGDHKLLEKTKLEGLGGSLRYDPHRDVIVLDRFGLSNVTLQKLNWEGGTMAIACSESIAISTVHVSGEIPLEGPRKLNHVHIEEIAASALTFRQSDMIVSTKEGGRLGIKGIDLCDLDLSSYDFELDIEKLSGDQLALDLGAGMTMSAAHLETKMSIKGLVADGKYDIALSDLQAKDLGLRLAESGAKVDIRCIQGASARIGADLNAGVYTFQKVRVPSIELGMIEYLGADLSFIASAGLGLDNLELDGEARMDDKGTHVRVSRLAAKTAVVPSLEYAAGSGRDRQSHSIRRATVDNLEICDLNLDDMTMDLTFDNGKVEGLSSKMAGMTLNGDTRVGSLRFAMLKDADGQSVTRMNFSEVAGDYNLHTWDNSAAEDLHGRKRKVGELTPEEREKKRIEDEERRLVDPTYVPDEEKTGTDTRAKLAVRGASGEVELSDSKTSFSEIKIQSVGLPKVDWRGGADRVEARDAAIEDVYVDGYIQTKDEVVRGMVLPTSDLVISRMHVETIRAKSIKYMSAGLAVEPAKEDGDMLRLEKLDIYDLRRINGVMEQGRITLEKAGLSADTRQASWNKDKKVETVVKLAGGIEAGGLYCDFDKGKASFGAAEVRLRNVEGEVPEARSPVYKDGKFVNPGMRFVAPELLVENVKGSAFSKYVEDKDAMQKSGLFEVELSKATFEKDASAWIYSDTKKKPNEHDDTKPKTVQDKTQQDLLAASKTAELMRRLAPLINDLDADLGFDLVTDAVILPKLRLKLARGVLDVPALLDSLKISFLPMLLGNPSVHGVWTGLAEELAPKIIAMGRSAVQLTTAADKGQARFSVSLHPELSKTIVAAIISQPALAYFLLPKLTFNARGEIELFGADGSADLLPKDSPVREGHAPLALILTDLTRKAAENADERRKQAGKHTEEERAKAVEAVKYIDAQIALIQHYQTLNPTFYLTHSGALSNYRLMRDKLNAEFLVDDAIKLTEAPKRSAPAARVGNLSGFVQAKPPDGEAMRRIGLDGLSFSYGFIRADIDTRIDEVTFGARLTLENLGLEKTLGDGSKLALSGDFRGHLSPLVSRTPFIPIGGDVVWENPLRGTIKAGSHMANVKVAVSSDHFWTKPR